MWFIAMLEILMDSKITVQFIERLKRLQIEQHSMLEFFIEYSWSEKLKHFVKCEMALELGEKERVTGDDINIE